MKGGALPLHPPKNHLFCKRIAMFCATRKGVKNTEFLFFMIFVDFHEKPEILKNMWKSEILLVFSMSRPSDPPQKQSATVEWSSYYKPICQFSRGAGNGETLYGPKSEILGIFMKIMVFPYFYDFPVFMGFQFFWNFMNFHAKGSRKSWKWPKIALVL